MARSYPPSLSVAAHGLPLNASESESQSRTEYPQYVPPFSTGVLGETSLAIEHMSVACQLFAHIMEPSLSSRLLTPRVALFWHLNGYTHASLDPRFCIDLSCD